MNHKRIRLLQVLVPLSYVLMVTINALANILPINGIGTGEVSDFYQDLFAPAGITFSIWGLIYILLAIFTVYFVINIKRVSNELQKLLTSIGLVFSMSSIANSFWIFAWHYDAIWLSLVLMIVILLSLIYINLSIKKYKKVNKLTLLVSTPFNVYFGWITVASIANIVTFLVWSDWGRFGISEVLLMNVIVLIGCGIGLLAMRSFKSFSYGFVIIWAYSGILLKHVTPEGFNGQYFSVIFVVICSITFLILGEVRLYRDNRKIKG